MSGAVNYYALVALAARGTVRGHDDVGGFENFHKIYLYHI